jgi:hypothetical protein
MMCFAIVVRPASLPGLMVHKPSVTETVFPPKT